MRQLAKLGPVPTDIPDIYGSLPRAPRGILGSDTGLSCTSCSCRASMARIAAPASCARGNHGKAAGISRVPCLAPLAPS